MSSPRVPAPPGDSLELPAAWGDTLAVARGPDAEAGRAHPTAGSRPLPSNSTRSLP
jgi:hypothetical protein